VVKIVIIVIKTSLATGASVWYVSSCIGISLITFLSYCLADFEDDLITWRNCLQRRWISGSRGNSPFISGRDGAGGHASRAAGRHHLRREWRFPRP